MPVPHNFAGRLSLPVIAAPMFIVSSPELVIAQCKAGVVGTMPSLNARTAEEFEPNVERIKVELAAHDAANPDAPSAPFGINLIVHKTNKRLEHDLAVCARQQVPLIITSLGASKAVNDAVHAYGGLVFHDVINIRHAKKAIAEGVDGIITVCAGAGGHAGTMSPFALVRELREFWDGPIALSGSISDGEGILGALAMGADFAYLGTRFIPTLESAAKPEYKQMILESSGADVIYTPFFTGVPGNYLRPSVVNAGLDPDNLPDRSKDTMDFGSITNTGAKAWKDIWGSGQGIGVIHDLQSTADLVATLRRQFEAAQRAVAERVGLLRG